MSRRLLNRSGRPASTNQASPSTTTTTTVTTLPPYEPLSFPLNDHARQSLGDLSNNRGTAAYEAQVKDSVRHLGLSVGDLHERLRSRKDRLTDVRARREEKGIDKTAEESRLEKEIPGFEKEVEQLTRESERALRELIDRKAELEDVSAVLGDVYTNAATSTSLLQTHPNSTTTTTQTRRRRNDQIPDELDDEEEDQTPEPQDPPIPSIIDTFRNLRTQKQEEYNNLPPHQRYALNNDYAGFKRIWHSAAAGEDGPPLPDASRWFLSNGKPNMTTPGTRKGASHNDGANNNNNGAHDNNDNDEDDDDDDDEVAVSREILSLNCPLTLLPMTEPYGNTKCPHVFEKAAILDYLPVHGERQCPQTGCSQTFLRSRFKHDFYLDEAMLRRTQRAKQAQDEMDVDDDDDEDDDAGNASVVLGPERHIRGGSRRVMKRERTSTVGR